MDNVKTYFIKVVRTADHWSSQETHRKLFVKIGITYGNIKWLHGTSGPNIPSTHTWQISCTEKQLFWIQLKTGAELVDN